MNDSELTMSSHSYVASQKMLNWRITAVFSKFTVYQISTGNPYKVAYAVS